MEANQEKTPEQLASEEQELTNKLNKTKADREAAQNKQKFEQEQAAAKLRQEQETLIGSLELQAAKYRSEADVVRRDSEKKKLYLFAYDAEVSANELRKELGYPLIQHSLDKELSELEKGLRRSILWHIFYLLFGAIGTLIVYMLSDFVGGKMNGNFFSYSLHVLSKIFYFISSVLGGCWLVCVIVFSFAPNYIIGSLKTDFNSLKPFHKMLLLTAIGATILHLLNGSNLYAVE